MQVLGEILRRFWGLRTRQCVRSNKHGTPKGAIQKMLLSFVQGPMRCFMCRGGISGMVVKWGFMIFSDWFLVSGCQGHLKFPSALGKSLRNNYLVLGYTKILYSIVLPCPTHSKTSSLKPKH